MKILITSLSLALAIFCVAGTVYHTMDNTTVLPQVRAGQVAVTSLLTSTNITFSTPFQPSSTYQIIQTVATGNLPTFGVPSNITTNGFTMNFTVGITSTLGYIAVLNQ